MMNNQGALSNRLDGDRLGLVNRDSVTQNAHAMLHPVDSFSGEEIAATIALLFAAAVERYAGSPEGLYEYGRRLLDGDRYKDTAFHTTALAQTDSLRDFFTDRLAIRRKH